MDNLLNNILELIGNTRGAKKTFLDTLNLPSSTIGDWKSGKNKSYTKRLPEIAAYFNVSVDSLLSGREEKISSPPENESERKNVIKIAGRDGTFIERKMTDEQIALIQAMLSQMPDADDSL